MVCKGESVERDISIAGNTAHCRRVVVSRRREIIFVGGRDWWS